MRIALRSTPALALGLACLTLPGSDLGTLVSVTESTWPDKNHIGVVCNAAANRQELETLREAAAPGTLITVVNTRSTRENGAAANTLRQHKVDYLVMLPGDRVMNGGGPETAMLVHNLANHGIFSVGTTPRAVKQGAVLAIGAATGGELLLTDRMVGTISVILPQKASVAPR